MKHNILIRYYQKFNQQLLDKDAGWTVKVIKLRRVTLCFTIIRGLEISV
jgi:hypothetical protein